MKVTRFFVLGVVLLAFLLTIFPIRGVSQPAYALYINVIDLTGGTQSTALTTFEQAARYWESQFTDSIIVNVNFDFASLGINILGSTSSYTEGYSFSSVKIALGGDATSAFDATAVSNLPSGSFMQFRTNDSSGAVIIDNNNTGNNYWMNVNIANARALGLRSVSDSTLDGSIQFSSDFSFDFDRADGIDSGSIDFFGISVHEIGHALGFRSGVGTVDYYSGSGPGAPLDLDPYRVFSVWDLYRYSNDSLSLGGSGTLDFATGGNPYFSINGGTTSLATFATGTYNGDGRQASHWKDNLGIGIMDPTFAFGELGTISSMDITAFDVMGYDVAPSVVPEPISSILFIVGGATLGFRRFRKKIRNI